MHDFLAMHGYAIYIWPSYAFAAIALGGLVIQTIVKGRKK